MRKKGNSSILIVVLLLGMALVGCAKKQQPPPPQAATPKPTVAATPASVPVQQQASSAKAGQVQFDFSSKKDPFKPFATMVMPASPAVGGKVGKPEEVLPIQRYDVTKFKVSGIIVGLKENSALIIDPKGKGYVVKEGMLIGENNGRIVRIAPTYLEVTEQYREENGRIRKRTTRLTLPQKK